MTSNPAPRFVTTLKERLASPWMAGGLFVLGLVVGAIWMASSDSTPAGAKSPSQTADHAEHAHQNDVYTCSMHPQIRQSEPGKCPLCGMDLILATSEESNTAAANNIVTLSPRAQALAALRTTEVRRQTDGAGELVLLGRLVLNETTKKSVTAWTGGRIDKLHVNSTGQKVRAGQVIATLYSPEVFAAHQDLLVGQKQLTQMQQSTAPNRLAAQSMLDAARERLRLLGVPDDEIKRLERASAPTQQIKIRSPFSGTVMERLATEGAYIQTGTPLYAIADLRKIWVELDAYESDLSRLATGQPVRVEVKGIPGDTFDGQVTFIEPTLDAKKRTAAVRVELENDDGRLRPGMFVTAQVTPSADPEGTAPLIIPATAPLFTGRRSIVYVEMPGAQKGTYAARVVRLGPRAGEYYPVVAGLAEGERVVSRGAFALDADLQIRGGASMMSFPDDTEAFPEEVVVVDFSPSERTQLAAIVSRYLEIHEALAADALTLAQQSAGGLVKQSTTVSWKKASAAQAWSELQRVFERAGQSVAGAKDIEAARAAFEALSLAMGTLLKQFGNPLEVAVHWAFCPMAMGSRGANWVQLGDVVDNPYFGASMKTCGGVQQRVPPGNLLKASALAGAPPRSGDGELR